MKVHEIKYKGKDSNYSVLIGNKTLNFLPKKVKELCPKVKKILFIIDHNVPKKFIKFLKVNLKNYEIHLVLFKANEKLKSFKTVNNYLNYLQSKNFNRSDLVISVGGGITGDITGFIASIFKRGINFINIPTTLLAQADSAIGGKTGVNSMFGKNLIGSFYQPKLVISDISFLFSLSDKEMVCGYAEILKHSIIKDKTFFSWLEKNTKHILEKRSRKLIYAVKKSCTIKMYFVKKDVSEKNLRMVLNFGHTFAHAIEVKNNYSKSVTHGEAVLSGIIMATRLSVLKNLCKQETFDKIKNLYIKNKLNYNINRVSKENIILSLIPFLRNDKKNNDERINFLLLKEIGKTTSPNKCKISIKELKKYNKIMAQY